METSILSPSPEARQVYNMMVVRADEHSDGELHLTLARSIELSVALKRRGEDDQAHTAVAELRAAEWIAPVPDGGWRIT